MKANYKGCAVCDSTWGNLWEAVEGTRLFFCCDICLAQFHNLVNRIKTETEWPTIDSITISGDRRGRNCKAEWGSQAYSCWVSFNAQGAIRTFSSDERNGPG